MGHFGLRTFGLRTGVLPLLIQAATGLRTLGLRTLGLQTLSRLGIPDYGLGTRTSRPSHLAYGAPTGLGNSALDFGLGQEAWSAIPDCGLRTRTVISASRDLPGDRNDDVSR